MMMMMMEIGRQSHMTSTCECRVTQGSW